MYKWRIGESLQLIADSLCAICLHFSIFQTFKALTTGS